MTTFLSKDDWFHIVKHAPLISIDLVIINQNNQVLVGLRNNEPAKNVWFVPGGIIRKDERIEAAFQRITTNELGHSIEYSAFDLLGMYEHHYSTNFAKIEGVSTHYICLAHKHTLKENILITPDDQHTEFQWMNITDLLSHDDVHDNTKAYFR